jgi:hypothetical protein
VAALVARNANDFIVVHMVRSDGIYVWREFGVRLSVMCWGVWDELGLIRGQKVFTFNLRYKEML